ncbi:SusC/RagA family TonB-linked outer membrane protein [Desertivirga brevis]|uniref:SusC/RagA family TonB-linked outer membrane protein n=1 Tax=Desertivirga brevis TaxID=2810310 RepID=UPI002106D9F8|nr:TonB-dependent receptor [Pedobacter sp. SYSU D00873]
MKHPGNLSSTSRCCSRQKPRNREGRRTNFLLTSTRGILTGFLGLLLSFLITTNSIAQNNANVITGRVMDSQGEPLPGVTIKIKGSSTGTSSDGKGNYRIKVDSPSDVLVFSFLGFNTVEKTIGSSNTLNVQMKESATRLEDVVVNIGYGTVNKRDITGAVATIKGEDLNRNLPISVNEGLQGMVAGVQVNRNDGAPGAGISLTIRGANSFTGSEPLYVVDDIPMVSAGTPGGAEDNFQTINGLASINPNDIESIEVLKDASATAIYGSRGANGVVLITTKKGKAGRDKVDFIANNSFATISKKVEMLGAYEYALLQNEAAANLATYYGSPLSVPFSGTYGRDAVTLQDNVYRPTPEDYISGLPAGTVYPQGFTGTNWQDQIFRTALTQDYTLQVSGGSDKGSHLISGNYLNQEGIIKRTGFKRYGAQLNMNRNVSKFFQIGTNTNVTYTNYLLGKTNTSGAQPSLISSALFFPPTWPLEDPYADIRQQYVNASGLSNPVLSINNSNDRTSSARIYTTGYGQLNFTPWLNFRQRFGYNYNTNSRETYYSRNIPEGRVPGGIASEAQNNYSQLTLESLLNFKRTINKKHNFNAVTAFSYEKARNYWNEQRASNFSTDLTQNYNLAAGLNPSPLYNYRADNALMSFLGRINYSYNGKYSFTANFRRDGSSKFAEGNKWANFGSAAFAWNASDETFIRKLNLFSTLKFRTSIGSTGNQGIGPYGTLYQMYVSNAPIDGNGTVGPGYIVNDGLGLVDPNLRWETTLQADAGLDLGFFNNRLSLTADVYFKRTKDLLQSVSIAPSTGFGTMLTNMGTVENRGLEVTLIGNVIQKRDLKWNLNGNISFNRNKLQDLPNDQYAQRLYHGVDQVLIQRNGQPIGAIYGLTEDGFYDNLAEVRGDQRWSGLSDAQLIQKIGTIKYKNMDNDPAVISQATDRTIIGSTLPDYSFGLTNTFNYKKFDFSVYVHGVIGGDIINTNLLKVRLSQTGNSTKAAFDGRWTPETAATATWPRADASSTMEYLFSDRYIEDGSFVRLKTLRLGYTFTSPAKFVGNLNVFVNANNLATFTKYSWFDPDVNSFGADASRRGVDMNSYPNTRTFTIGFRASL